MMTDRNSIARQIANVDSFGSRGLACVAALALLSLLPGCGPPLASAGRFDMIWGKQGVAHGRFQKPRAMAIDAQDNIYVVDMTARIQVFDSDGEYLRGWQTPEHKNGRPTGLSIDRDGNVLVADTHYYQVLVYSPRGELLRKLGNGHGHGPGEFGTVTDAVQDSEGNYYVAEYGEFDRIQKFDRAGKFLLQWGGHGKEPGQFMRPQKLEFDDRERLWVADACNHRIQVFDKNGALLELWGTEGSAPGQLYYPYDLTLDGEGHVYVAEFGNHRVQKFTLAGESLGCWGRNGREPGELANPWALVRDSQGRIHVLDTLNHRVQRIRL